MKSAVKPPPGAYRGRRRVPSKRSLPATIGYLLPASALLLILMGFPVANLLRMSVSDVGIGNILGDWQFVGLQNFADLFAMSEFTGVVWQTLGFVAFTVVTTLLFGLAGGLLFQPSGIFSFTAQVVLTAVWVLPPIVVGALWRFLLASDGAVGELLMGLGLVNDPIAFLSRPETALASVAVVTVWITVPFATLVLKAAILDVPRELLEAARVDGANAARTFLQITMPLIRPTLLILAVLLVVAAFRAFDLIYAMTRGGPGTSSMTLPFLGYTQAFQSFEFGLAAATSVIAMLVVVSLAFAYSASVRKEND